MYTVLPNIIFTVKINYFQIQKNHLLVTKEDTVVPQQINYFNACRISSNINDVIGPLFQTYKNCYPLKNNLKTKIIISVFLCSTGEKVLHPLNSHLTF